MSSISKSGCLVVELIVDGSAIVVKLNVSPYRRVDAIRERVERALVIFAAIVSFS
jgi:hypothetical protein